MTTTAERKHRSAVDEAREALRLAVPGWRAGLLIGDEPVFGSCVAWAVPPEDHGRTSCRVLRRAGTEVPVFITDDQPPGAEANRWGCCTWWTTAEKLTDWKERRDG